MAVTEFRILGPLDVRENGQTIDVGGGKQRALLALLLLRSRETVATDALIDALWGERPPESATSSLHAYVSRLRRALGRDRLVRNGHGYRLVVKPDELDVTRFEQLLSTGRARLEQGDAEAAAETLRAALALWYGPPLAELRYEPFASQEIARLEELHLDAVEERIDADLALGRHAPLVAELEALVREHPLRERLRGQLMLALYRSGRQADALRIYREGRASLVRELGLEPGPELQQLEHQILDHDPALGPPEPRARPARARSRRWQVAAAAAALVVAGGVTIFFAIRHDSSPAPVAVFANSVAVIDAKTNRVVDDIPVDRHPVGLAYRGGEMWVANTGSNTVSLIDVKTHAVDRIGIGVPPTDIVVTGSKAVWTGNGSDGSLTEVSPAFRRVVHRVDLRGPETVLPRSVNALTFGAGSLWAATSGHEVVRVNPRTRRRLSIRLDAIPLAIAYGVGALWVITSSNELVRIDPHTNKPTGRRLVGFTFGNALATRTGEVWVGTTQDYPGRSERGAVSRFSARTTELKWRIRVPSPVAIAAGSGSIWVASGAGKVYRIDPDQDEVVATIPVAGGTAGIAVVDDTVWVSV